MNSWNRHLLRNKVRRRISEHLKLRNQSSREASRSHFFAIYSILCPGLPQSHPIPAMSTRIRFNVLQISVVIERTIFTFSIPSLLLNVFDMSQTTINDIVMFTGTNVRHKWQSEKDDL